MFLILTATRSGTPASQALAKALLALFLVDFVLLAFVPALGRCILSARLFRLEWRRGGGTARDAIVGLRIKQVLHLGVFLILNHDGEV